MDQENDRFQPPAAKRRRKKQQNARANNYDGPTSWSMNHLPGTSYQNFNNNYPKPSTNWSTASVISEAPPLRDLHSPILNTVPDITASIPIQDRVRIVPRAANSGFIGRRSELKQLSNLVVDKFKHQHAIDIAIVGEIGTGKTELLLKFISDNSQKFHHIIWHTYETEEKMEQFFINLGTVLNLAVPIAQNDLRFPIMLSRIYNLLAQHNTLIVFDAIDEPVILAKFLPTAEILESFPIFIIVTSHNINWDCNNKIELNAFSVALTMQLFAANNVQSARDNDLFELASLVDFNPALLKILLDIIKKKKGIKLDDFISNFNFDMIMKNDNFNLILNSFVNTVNIVKKNDEDLVLKILNMISYFDAGNMFESLFYSIFISPDLIQIEDIFNKLEQFSLIKFKNDKIIISKYIQEIIKFKFKNDQYLPHAFSLLEKHIEFGSRYPKFKFDSSAIHALKIWKHESLDSEYIINFSKIPAAIITANCSHKKYFSFETDIFKKIEHSLTYNNIDFLQLINLSINTDENPIKSLEFCTEVFSKIPQELMEHMETLKIIFKKGVILNALNKPKDALNILEDVYQKQRDKIGIDHDDTLETIEKMCFIASKHKEMEKLETCLTFLRQRFTNIRLDHIKSLMIMKFIPEHLHACEKDGESLKLYDYLYQTLENKYGATGELSLQANLAKAECLIWLKKYDMAYDELLKVNTKQLSANIDNVKTITKLCSTATLLSRDKESKCFEFCFSLIEERIKNKDNLEGTLLILHELCFTCQKRTKCYEFYSKLYVTLPTPPYHATNQRILISKIDCLLLDLKYDEAWMQLSNLYKLQCDHNLDIVKTVATMCNVACEMEQPFYLNEWSNIMNQITDYELCLLIMEKVVTFNSFKTSKVVIFYDKMITTLIETCGHNSPPVLRTILGKSWHIWCLDQRDEAWKMYEDVCNILDVEPDLVTQRRKTFCNTLGNLLKIIKDMKWNCNKFT